MESVTRILLGAWDRRDKIGSPCAVMQYMVIETFLPNCKPLVYERFREKGRMLPEGLRYIDSWVENNGDRCFQLMETDSPELFATWIGRWSDLVSFKLIELEDRVASQSAN
jgi:hypothetical protein